MAENSNYIQATTLDYSSIHRNNEEGELWRRPAIYGIAAISIIVAIGAGLIMAAFRSATVGITPSLWLVMIVTMSPIFLLGVFVTSSRAAIYRRRLLLFMIGCLITPVLSSELWFGIEESLYRQSLAARRLAVDYSDRWWPFESSGLVWNGKAISAHD